MNDFLTQIYNLINSVFDNDIAYQKYTGDNREFCTYDYEIFDKNFDRLEGQVIVEVNSLNPVTLLNEVEDIRKAIDNFTYATENSASNFNFVSLNDISRLETFDYARQLIFEFKLYTKEV